jgi:rhomboid family protein
MIPIGDDDSAQRTTPWVTYGLVALNVLVFLLELANGDAFITKWSFVPARFLADPGRQLATIFTAMFMHAGWVHLLGNMLFLWIFGDNVEDRFGHSRYLIFYLLCGVLATFTQLAFTTHSDIPNLGASGAIAGVLGAYVLMFPEERIRVYVVGSIVPMPAWAMIGLWIVIQLFSGIAGITTAAQTGGVAYLAHIGGFASGLVLADLFESHKQAFRAA